MQRKCLYVCVSICNWIKRNSLEYIKGTDHVLRGRKYRSWRKGKNRSEHQKWSVCAKVLRWWLGVFLIGIFLLAIVFWKAVVKEKLPNWWSEPISDLRNHNLIVDVILSRQPWHPMRGFCLSPHYFLSLTNHSHFTHDDGNISTMLSLKKK